MSYLAAFVLRLAARAAWMRAWETVNDVDAAHDLEDAADELDGGS